MNHNQQNNNQVDSLIRNIKQAKGPQKWLLLGLLLIALIFGVDNLNFISDTQTGDLDSAQIEAVESFNGENFNVLPQMAQIPIELVRIVDGDTIVAQLNQQDIRIRYLMIDTPETVAPGVTEQPFGKEASRRNEALLSESGQITMMLDQGPATDQYNRALAYVYADDINVAEKLLEEGLAAVRYVNPPNNSLEESFRQAQESALAAERGIWSISDYVDDNGRFNRLN